MDGRKRQPPFPVLWLKMEDELIQEIKERERNLRNCVYCTRLDVLARQVKRSRTFENLMPSAISVAREIAESYDRLSDLICHVKEGLFLINDHHFERLLTELLNNAFRFSRKGDKVEFSFSSIELSAYLTVKNEGEGMHEQAFLELQEHLQQSLVKVLWSSQWGLRIVHKIADLYDAQIKLDNKPFESFKVEIVFPKVTPKDPELYRAAVTGCPFPWELNVSV